MPAAAGPSRPSFRPRPIDLAKPLPIIKSSKDLRHEDDVVVNRALPTIATGVDPSEEEERHLQQALLASVFGSSDKPPDIPVPVVSSVSRPNFQNNPNQFQLPQQHYILFDRPDTQLIQQAIEYDADFVDEAFAKKENISIGLIEIVMDILEKAQGNVETLVDSIPPILLQQQQHLKLSNQLREKLFSHWKARRQKHKRPFLRFFQQPPDPNDTDPSVAFRPRDREAGVTIAHRMNTYDNYRRALIIRDELSKLSKLMSDVVERERKKEQLLAVRMLLQRIKIATAAPTQIDNIVRHVFTQDSEPILQLPTSAAAIPTNNNKPGTGISSNQQQQNIQTPIIPCRGISIPSDIPVEHRRLVIDRVAKKARRKSSKVPPDKRNNKDPAASASDLLDTNRTNNNLSSAAAAAAAASSSALPSHVGSNTNAFDTFGFDEHGNRFLKLMRCFAGGFINYGVSPYDHRVYAAASERNTVRALPREPRPISFPSTALKFARPFSSSRFMHGSGAKVGPKSSTPSPSSSTPSSSFVASSDVKHDILSTRKPPPVTTDNNNVNNNSISHQHHNNTDAQFHPDAPPSKRRRVIRVRGRVGRGGRIIFDRVPFERERGAKAASYPASVEMGGVYTGGIPLDAASRISKEVSNGNMGDIARLSPTSIFSSNDDDTDEYESMPTTRPQSFADDLWTPLKPMMDISKGAKRKDEPDVINFWPRKERDRLHHRHRSRHNRFDPVADGVRSSHTEGLENENVHNKNNKPSSANVIPQLEPHQNGTKHNTEQVLRAEELRKLPAYYPRHDHAVHDIL